MSIIEHEQTVEGTGATEAVALDLSVLVEEPFQLQDLWDLYLLTRAGKGAQAPLCGTEDCGSCPVVTRNHGLVWQVRDEFLAAVAEMDTHDAAVACGSCGRPVWRSACDSDVDGLYACDECLETLRDQNACSECGRWSVDRFWLVTTLPGAFRYCQQCTDDYLEWCEICEEHNRPEDNHPHGGCDCEPLPLEFTFPGNSHGPLAQDERLLVELPAGFVTEAATAAVISLLWGEQYADQAPPTPIWSPNNNYYQVVKERDRFHLSLAQAVDGLEREWQTKRGNWCRRLSKALHDAGLPKLKPGLLSRAGSIVRQHTSNVSSWHVALTRDLNQPAGAFYHKESCWFGDGSEVVSLCALKNWGGLALRSYSSPDDQDCYPSGRAWVQPLGADMMPTADAMGARAYLVYNCYGDLEGYNAVRLVAYLSSLTYRRISLNICHQYVNNSVGYLVADQATCDATERVSIRGLDFHTAVALPRQLVSA